MRFYIHQSFCISPQQTFGEVDLETINPSTENKMLAVEPPYPFFNANATRRMGKSTRMGTGAALMLLADSPNPDGIIIGTQLSGMTDNSKFLDQIVDYNEDALTPGSFVQGTPNNVSAQIGLATGNKNYNVTHVHRGLAFENALIDTAMLLAENPNNTYLVGAVDEVSRNNNILDRLSGWFKHEECANTNIYSSSTAGSINGEGAAMFLVSNTPAGAIAAVTSPSTLHTTDVALVQQHLQKMLAKLEIDLLISGENGDINVLKYYTGCEDVLSDALPIVRFKHLTGEYPTASAFALWLAGNVVSQRLTIPTHLFKKGSGSDFKNILIYNCHKGSQHSFTLVSRA